MELSDGRLAVASQVLMPEDQEFAEVLSCSDDGGKTWYTASTIAYDGYHRYCEGAIVLLNDGDLACVMRENHSRGVPSFVVFSSDLGATWSKPQRVPFALHRPYAKQLPDGRVLVTGRHVNGPMGTYAWIGDIKDESGTHEIGGPRGEYDAEMTSEALVISNTPESGCRYTLLPPESSLSEVVMEADVKVEGTPGDPVAFMSISHIGVLLRISSDGIGTNPGVDFQKSVDMTRYRRLTLHHKGGLMQLKVDGKTLINQCVFREDVRTYGWYGKGWFLGMTPFGESQFGMTQFGELGDQGRSHWGQVRYEVKNRTVEDWNWEWNAADGKWPDQYQRDRMIQIHANEVTEDHRPDHGYSSWLTLPDGRIILVDYTNFGDPMGQSHLVGTYFEPEVLRT